MAVEEDLQVYRSKARVFVMGGFLAAMGLLALALQFVVESEDELLMHVPLTIIGLFALYAGASVVAQAREVSVILRPDGMVVYPFRLLFTRRETRFIPWEDIDRIRYILTRGSRALDVYTHDRPAPKDSGSVNFYRVKPAARIPVLMLTIPDQELLREMRERAWKRGIVLH